MYLRQEKKCFLSLVFSHCSVEETFTSSLLFLYCLSKVLNISLLILPVTSGLNTKQAHSYEQEYSKSRRSKHTQVFELLAIVCVMCFITALLTLCCSPVVLHSQYKWFKSLWKEKGHESIVLFVWKYLLLKLLHFCFKKINTISSE